MSTPVPAGRPKLSVGAFVFGVVGVAGVIFGAVSAMINYRNSGRPHLVENCDAPRRGSVLKRIESERDGLLMLNQEVYTVRNDGRVPGFINRVSIVDIEQSGVELNGAYVDRTVINPGETRDIAVRFWSMVPKNVYDMIGSSLSPENRAATLVIRLEDDRGQSLYHSRDGQPFEGSISLANIRVKVSPP